LKTPQVFLAAAATLLAATLHAQQLICPTNFPSSPSPVPSYSADDIPATVDTITTWTGTAANVRANHNMSFVQINANEQRVWFSPDASPGLHRAYYNRRTRASETSPWQWDYSNSPAVMEFAAPSSSGPAAVLYSPIAMYRDPQNGATYQFLMYQVFQPSSCDGIVAGFLYYSLSADGICWTAPRQVVRPGGPSFGCHSAIMNTVPIESATAIDAGDKVVLVGVEGDIQNQLAVSPTETSGGVATYRRWSNFDRTQTYMGYTNYSDPSTLVLFPNPELSTAGLFLPQTGTAYYDNPTRYKTYAYFMNMQAAWDAGSGYFYIGRGYPYPFDRASKQLANANLYDPPVNVSNTPSDYQVANGCASSPGIFPNRIQIYRMYLGSLANIGQLATGTWTLMTDLGGTLGYRFATTPSTSTPLVAGQSYFGADVGAISFLRDSSGFLYRQPNSQAFYFGAHTFRESKSDGPCRTTGLEREILANLP
jgi:hypothetical protein